MTTAKLYNCKKKTFLKITIREHCRILIASFSTRKRDMNFTNILCNIFE